MDCVPPDGSVVQPDVGYISVERSHIFQDHVMGAPDVVVEVLSRGTRRFDRIKKLDVYRRNGVREAWLVDPDAQTVTVFFGESQQWVREQSVLFGGHPVGNPGGQGRRAHRGQLDR
jgi:Uma2 family endonuclease